MGQNIANPESAPAKTKHDQELPLILRIALVGIAYFALALVARHCGDTVGGACSMWPPSGLAFGAIIVGGFRLWPGIACGALAAALADGASYPAALLFALGNTADPVITVRLLQRLAGFRRSFHLPRAVGGFILLAGFVGAPISALLVVASSILDARISVPDAQTALFLAWGGSFGGALTLGPLLIGARQVWQEGRPRGMRTEFLVSISLLIVAIGTGLLGGPMYGLNEATLLVLPFPVVVWIAWRFGIGGAVVSLLLVGTASFSARMLDCGPFAHSAGIMGYANLLLYVVVVAATALGLAAFNGQREHALERLQQREWQLNEAQRIGNLGVWVWDLDTDSFKLSDGALRILGSIQGQSSPSPESLLTRLIPEDRRAVEEMLLRVRQSCQRETCEARVRRDEDHLRHVTIACSAVINHRGQVTSLLGTLFDFTERKHYEDEQVRLQRRMLETQKLESLGMLASGIAHDFNNLLTGILGNSSLLRIQLPDGSPMAEGLRRIESSAERAADLCRQMLAYSGKGRFVVRTIDLNELARGTMVLAQTSMPRKAMLSLSPAATSPRIRADMMQLRQVVLNLLLNAAESLPEDGGKVDVRVGTLNVDKAWLASAYLAPDLPAAEYAFIEVSDTGCGIPSDLQQRIFEPFFTTKFTGRGLGLAAVAGIARAHRGAVRVASKAGEGSRFTVVLPFDTEPASASFAPPGPLLAGTARLPATAQPTGPLVLIVDDEETILQVASEYLTKNGLPTATATDGVQALERFGDGRDYRGVVLDYAMPRLDGLGTFKQMRQRRPDIPVLLTSGFEADEALERFAGLGITGFLQKPFTGAGLLAALRTALGQEAPPPPPDTPAGDI